MAVERAQHRRRVRGAAAHPRAHGDMLIQRDGHALPLLPGGAQIAQRRLDREVSRIAGDEGEIAFSTTRPVSEKEISTSSARGHGLHHHGHVVVAVRAALGGIEGDVELRPGFFMQYRIQMESSEIQNNICLSV